MKVTYETFQDDLKKFNKLPGIFAVYRREETHAQMRDAM